MSMDSEQAYSDVSVEQDETNSVVQNIEVERSEVSGCAGEDGNAMELVQLCRDVILIRYRVRAAP